MTADITDIADELLEPLRDICDLRGFIFIAVKNCLSVMICPMSAETITAIPECLWTKVCPNCGYSLEGAPSAGTCSECGRAYDQSAVILHGHGRGSHENVTTANKSRLLWVASGSILFFFFQGINLLLSPDGRHWIFAYVAIAAILLLYGLARRKGTDHPGLVQVRLTPAGCVQFDDLGGPSVPAQVFVSYLWIVPAAAIVGLPLAYGRGWMGGIVFWIFLPIAMILMPLIWKSSAEFRRAIGRINDSDIADANIGLQKPIPWKHISSFEIARLGDNSHRLRIQRKSKFLISQSEKWPVDIEINFGEQQTTQLRILIHDWINQARKDSQ